MAISLLYWAPHKFLEARVSEGARGGRLDARLREGRRDRPRRHPSLRQAPVHLVSPPAAGVRLGRARGGEGVAGEPYPVALAPPDGAPRNSGGFPSGEARLRATERLQGATRPSAMRVAPRKNTRRTVGTPLHFKYRENACLALTFGLWRLCSRNLWEDWVVSCATLLPNSLSPSYPGTPPGMASGHPNTGGVHGASGAPFYCPKQN